MAELPGTLSSAVARWGDVADDLEWSTPCTELFRADPPLDHWFVDGTLNLSVNCVDRHLTTRRDRVAVYWEGEPGDRRELTYGDLYSDVGRLAAGLQQLGVGVGDRVALHLGWLPETVVAILACARIGAEYTVIPVALPVEALALRLDDFRPQVLFTQDGGWRHGAILPLKARADEALEATTGVEHTVVVRRSGVQVDWFSGDRWYDDVLATAPAETRTPVPLPSDHPALAVHLANRRGRPVSVRHGTANIAAAALAVHRHGLAAGEVYWCAADVSWLGAQAHGACSGRCSPGTAP
jgi:acetyl-CoA synthetase